jgi:hypothetical protein
MNAVTLRIDTLQNCKVWLAQLPLSNAPVTHGALGTQLKLLNASAVEPAVRLQILESLRETIVYAQAERAKRFCNQPVPLDAPNAAIWSEVIALWETVLQGYEGCVGAGALSLPLIHQRAMDCIGMAMLDHNRIYRAIPIALWQQLHKLYGAAEAAGLGDAAVPDADGGPPTSCTATYLQALLAQRATPDAMTLAQLGTTRRWAKQWAALVKLSPAPDANRVVPQLGVLLGAGGGARDAASLQPAPDARFLDLDRLGAMLIQLVAALRNGKSPADLALGTDIRQPACENLLLLLSAQWCGMGNARAEERSPSALKVMVSMSIAAMHFHLTGRAFRQPGAPLSKREEEDLQMFGHVSERTERALLSQRSGALETWEIINHSRSGILSMCRRPDAATRISHNQLLGLRTATGRTFYLGIVQRLQIDGDGAVSIGLRVIPGTPQPVAARPAGVVSPEGNKYDRALLMPADEARRIPASLILVPNTYQPGRTVELFTDAVKAVKLTALLDKGVNFERATIDEP